MEILDGSLKFLFWLFFLFAGLYLVILILSGTEALCRMERDRKERFRRQTLISDELFRGLPVSILIPAHNEETSLCAGIHTLLRLDYPVYEIVVVNDGSTDRTLEALLDAFPLQRVRADPPERLPARPISRVYRCVLGGVPITVVDKQPGGKADALNAGINFCRYPHFVTVDADTMLPYDSLRKIAFPFAVRPGTVACGGAVYTAKELYAGAKVNPLLLAFQKLETCGRFTGCGSFSTGFTRI
jgi:cellulose synthase/poly-beta-1,6-N-acetylglucosamine synthase-like glycosyltransferase